MFENFSPFSFDQLSWLFDRIELEEPVVPDSIMWGRGPIVTPVSKDRAKTRQQRQNESLLILLL